MKHYGEKPCLKIGHAQLTDLIQHSYPLHSSIVHRYMYGVHCYLCLCSTAQIGLAVGDIEQIRREASLNIAIAQVTG